MLLLAEDTAMLQPRELMPLFKVTQTMDGESVDYRTIWQRKNLVLVSAPLEDPGREAYVASLAPRSDDLRAHDTALVITADAIAGVPSPGIVIADRWGEIYYVTGKPSAADLPGPDDLVEWLRYVQVQCPECHSETR